MTFLFWNLCGRPLREQLATLAHAHDADLVITAENLADSTELILALNADGHGAYHEVGEPTAAGRRQIRLFSRLGVESVQLVSDEAPGIAVRRVVTHRGDDFLLVAVHLRSKLFITDTSHEQYVAIAEYLVPAIKRAEKLVGHKRSLLVGDFNMNPFERGMVAGSALHAVSSRAVAQSGPRLINSKRREFFYNPMWSFLGERTGPPPGTFFLSGSQDLEYFWHTLDQVLVRPDLLPYFRDEDVTIPQTTGDHDLVDHRGRPNKKLASDHLPLIFKLNLLAP